MIEAQSHRPIAEPAADVRRVDVLICGGGISGLALAAWLAREGVDAAVLDKNSEPGGVIGTIHQDGFIFERGPNTILDKYDSLRELVELAGLDNEILSAPLREQKRFIWFAGRLNEVPTGPLAFLTTPLLPPMGKLALLREPFVARAKREETVAEFVERRLHRSWVTRLITPMVTGIWAGDPERMSILHTFPIMKEIERDGGSLVRGAVKLMRRKKAERRATGKPRRVKSLVSFRDGLQRLPIALAERLGERYHPATRIGSIRSLGNGAGFAVQAERDGQATEWQASQLVIAAEADRAAGWLAPMDSEMAATLRAFPYNRLVAVGLGIERAEAPGLPPGFGFLTVRGEGVRLLGAIVNSNFLPGRAPAGCAALTIFIGGDLDPAAFDLTDDEILGLLRRDLKKAIGWSGKVRSVHIERWPRAIPQYDMRHGERLRQIESAEARWPGLRLAGNWRGGVSIGDRVEAMGLLGKQISNLLRAGGERENRQ